MKLFPYLLTALLLAACSPAEELSVYAFLSTECPLSREQTYALREVYQQYGETVQFFAVFPNESDDSTRMGQFAEKYKLPFRMIRDPEHRWVDSLKASVTPQVFLVEKAGTVLYAGQIDNRMLSLGKKRKVVTEHYLETALAEALAGKPISVRKTKAVGCSIFSSVEY